MEESGGIYQFDGGNGLYHIIVLIVAAVAVVRGFRSAFTGQICSALGLGFGAVCAHIFSDIASQTAQDLFPFPESMLFPEYKAELWGAIGIFIIVYSLFCIFTRVFRFIMKAFSIGMLNRIVGSLFSLINYLLWLSMALNILISLQPASSLLRQASADDGNIVGVVLSMTSTFLGCRDAEDLAHLVQLKEAKKISLNYETTEYVINKKDFSKLTRYAQS